MSNYCESCYSNGPVVRRVGRFLLCDSCASYEERWQSWSLEDRKADLLAMIEHSTDPEQQA